MRRASFGKITAVATHTNAFRQRGCSSGRAKIKASIRRLFITCTAFLRFVEAETEEWGKTNICGNHSIFISSVRGNFATYRGNQVSDYWISGLFNYVVHFDHYVQGLWNRPADTYLRLWRNFTTSLGINDVRRLSEHN